MRLAVFGRRRGWRRCGFGGVGRWREQGRRMEGLGVAYWQQEEDGEVSSFSLGYFLELIYCVSRLVYVCGYISIGKCLRWVVVGVFPLRFQFH